MLSRLKKKDSDLYKESVNYFSLDDSKAGATTEKKHNKQPRYQVRTIQFSIRRYWC